LGAYGEIQNYWQSLNLSFRPATIIDIFIVALLLYWLYVLVRQTRALRIFYGIMFLFLLWLIGRALNLATLNYLLNYIITATIVAIPVVFQPELRAALEKLGRPQIVTDLRRFRRPTSDTPLNIIVETAEILAHRKIGAIIILARKTGLREYVEAGVRLDARLSTELLLSVFSPQSALHDGAVIVQDDRVLAARVILPLSDNKSDYHLGTRHRAGVGLTAQSDALAIIVSEERGEISLAADGRLEAGLDAETLLKKIRRQLGAESIKKTKK